MVVSFYKKAGLVLTTCMLEKRYNRNPNFTKRSKLDRVAPVGNRPPTHKNGGPKQWWGVAPTMAQSDPLVN